MIERVPMRRNPQLLDRVITALQWEIADKIGWLEHVFGRAERLIKIINGKRYYTPNVYTGGNDYELIAPDSGFGNYCFFVVDEPQEIDYNLGNPNIIESPFSIIFWVDMRTLEDVDERDTEAVKQSILRVLNGQIFLRYGTFTINRVYERAENVFSGFTLDEVDNQYLMHPFAGWRFSGKIRIKDTCYEGEAPETKYLTVVPEKTQWVRKDRGVEYRINSNGDWILQ